MKPLIAQFEDDLNTVVDKYREQGLTVGEAVGTLETVKLELYLEQREQDEEERM